MIKLTCLECNGAQQLQALNPDGSDAWVVDVPVTYDCPSCRGTGYLLPPPDLAELAAALLIFGFVFAGFALFAWWVLS